MIAHGLRSAPAGLRRWSLAFVLLLTLNSGLVFVAVPQLLRLSPGDYNVWTFPDGYDMIAGNLAAGNGYRFHPETSPTLYRAPGYVFALAGIFRLFGRSLAAAQLLNVLLVSLTALIVMRLSRLIVDSGVVSLCAGLLFLFHPAIVLSGSRAGVETLMTFGLVLFLYLFYQALDSGRAATYALAGAALGASLLVKQSHLFFAFFITPLVLTRAAAARAVPAAARNVLIMFFCAGVVYAPWVARNYAVTGEFVPTMTVRGAAAFQGLSLNTDNSGEECGKKINRAGHEQNTIARDAGYRFRKGFIQHFYDARDEVAFDRLLFGMVVREYRERPALLASSVLKNSVRFWFQGRTRKATLLNVAVVLPFLSLALAGTVAGYRRGLNVTPLLVLAAALMFPHLPMLALARHHVPLIPVLSILAALSLLFVAGAGETSRRPHSEPRRTA